MATLAAGGLVDPVVRIVIATIIANVAGVAARHGQGAGNERQRAQNSPHGSSLANGLAVSHDAPDRGRVSWGTLPRSPNRRRLGPSSGIPSVRRGSPRNRPQPHVTDAPADRNSFRPPNASERENCQPRQ